MQITQTRSLVNDPLNAVRFCLRKVAREADVRRALRRLPTTAKSRRAETPRVTKIDGSCPELDDLLGGAEEFLDRNLSAVSLYFERFT
jgi:hypothetical protein